MSEEMEQRCVAGNCLRARLEFYRKQFEDILGRKIEPDLNDNMEWVLCAMREINELRAKLATAKSYVDRLTYRDVKLGQYAIGTQECPTAEIATEVYACNNVMCYLAGTHSASCLSARKVKSDAAREGSEEGRA